MDIITTFVFYFLGFAVIHSLLATDYIKNRAEKRLADAFRFYRSIYTIISFFTLAPALLIWVTYTSSTPHIYSIPRLLYPVLFLIRLGALGMFAYAAYQTNIFDLIGIKKKTKNKLITKDAYGIVRHPLYTCSIIVLFTQINMSLLDLIAVLLVSIYLIIGAFIEERRLISIFGEQYRKYQQQVSMFIPVKWVMRFIWE